MTGELIKPQIEKSRPITLQKRPSLDPSPNETLTSNPKQKEEPKEAETQQVKKRKLNDGTEVITLCISPSDDVSRFTIISACLRKLMFLFKTEIWIVH